MIVITGATGHVGKPLALQLLDAGEEVRVTTRDAANAAPFNLDQCHNIEDNIPGQIPSVLNAQAITARPVLVSAVQPLGLA